VIFRNLGSENGQPRFQEFALQVNDFPTDADKDVRRTGDFFDKMIRERRILYAAPGPTADYDNDGRLDMFLANWWIESPSLLLRNETQGGNWLQVHVIGTEPVNRMAVGARIQVYSAGNSGRPEGLLVSREIGVGFGYASGQPSIAHFGLGAVDKVDIHVVLPHGNGQLTRKAVAANQRITLQ
jgi:enediyne biosynthesis protein E4